MRRALQNTLQGGRAHHREKKEPASDFDNRLPTSLLGREVFERAGYWSFIDELFVDTDQDPFLFFRERSTGLRNIACVWRTLCASCILTRRLIPLVVKLFSPFAPSPRALAHNAPAIESISALYALKPCSRIVLQPILLVLFG